MKKISSRMRNSKMAAGGSIIYNGTLPGGRSSLSAALRKLRVQTCGLSLSLSLSLNNTATSAMILSLGVRDSELSWTHLLILNFYKLSFFIIFLVQGSGERLETTNAASQLLLCSSAHGNNDSARRRCTTANGSTSSGRKNIPQ